MTDRPTPPKTRADFEKALRGLGFSQRTARRVSMEGFYPRQGERDIVKAIRRFAEGFESGA